MALDLKIRNNHLHHNGFNYFRGHAEEVLLGDVGEKCTPATQTNYLAVQGNVVRKQLKIHAASRIDLKGLAVASADIGGSIEVAGLGSLGAGAVAAGLASAELSLLKLSVLPKDIVALIHDNPKNALTPLKQAGARGRIVHQVYVLLQAKLAAVIGGAAGFTLEAEGAGVTLNATGGLAGASGASATLSPGSTFAYALLDPVWDANQQKNWKRIVDWKDDQWSLY
jgi:hypothetical protein